MGKLWSALHSGTVPSLHCSLSRWSRRFWVFLGENGVGASAGVGKTALSRPNSAVEGVSVLEVCAGDSPVHLGLDSDQKAGSNRARGEGLGRATKSRVLGRSGAQRRRGVGGKTRLGSGRRGTLKQLSFNGLKTPVFSSASFSGSGSRLFTGQCFLMAPSEGIRRRLRDVGGADGTCVGVSD